MSLTRRVHGMASIMEEDSAMADGREQERLTTPDDDVHHVPAKSKCRSLLQRHLFLWCNLAGIVFGLLLGVALRPADLDPDGIMWLGLPGELYLRTLKMLVLPLIVCSVVTGTASTNPKTSGRIGGITVAYILCTNAACGLFAIPFYYLLQPGTSHYLTDATRVDTKQLTTLDVFVDFIRNLFPDNVVGAALQQTQTKYTARDDVTLVNVSGQMVNVTSQTLVRSLGVVDSTNLVGLIVLSSAFGIAASQVGEPAQPFIAFFRAGNLILFKLFDWAKWSGPVGAASLVATALVKVDNLESAFSKMGIFVAAIVLGCACLFFIIVPFLHFILTRRNPVTFLISTPKICLISMGPPSSAFALPLMLQVSVDTFQVQPYLSDFVLPAGLMISRPGTTMFMTICSLFMAAWAGTTMAVSTVTVLVILNFLFALATPSVPSASIIGILLVLDSLGIVPTNLGLVLAVEFINDRVRTPVNAASLLNCCIVVSSWTLSSRRRTGGHRERVVVLDKVHCEDNCPRAIINGKAC